MSSGYQPRAPSFTLWTVLEEGPTRNLTSYLKHHYRDDQLQQNYQNMVLIRNGSVVLTHDAFLQEERAACPTTLGGQRANTKLAAKGFGWLLV